VIALAMSGAIVLSQAAAAGPNCTCRANGKNFQIGEVLCILGRLAQCRMNQNNPSWQPIGNACPQAHANPHQTLLACARSPLSALPSLSSYN